MSEREERIRAKYAEWPNVSFCNPYFAFHFSLYKEKKKWNFLNWSLCPLKRENSWNYAADDYAGAHPNYSNHALARHTHNTDFSLSVWSSGCPTSLRFLPTSCLHFWYVILPHKSTAKKSPFVRGHNFYYNFQYMHM